jgi:peptide/nickel transport system substrate-binding protein
MAKEQISDLVERLSTGQLSRRQFIQRAVGLGLSASAISAILGGAAEAAPKPAGAGALNRFQADAKTLVITDNIQGGNWLYLDPGHFYEINPSAAMTVVYESLYYLPDGNKLTDFQPLLADGMPQVSTDGLTVTVKLRQGVKFQNSGNPLTADDVVFSWKRLGALKDNPAFLYNDYVKDVVAPDPSTVKVTLQAPNAAFIAIMSANMYGIMDSKVAKAHGADDTTARPGVQDPFTQNWLNKGNSCGTGPYKLTGWDISNEITLDRNPDYWGEAPKLDKIIFRNIAKTSEQLQAVQTG